MVIKSLFSILVIVPVFSWAQTQYVVRKGDTLLKIADKSLGATKKTDPRRYEVAKKIRELNPNMKNPNALEPGETIVVPADTKTPAPTKEEALNTALPVNPIEKPVAPEVKPAPVTEDELKLLNENPQEPDCPDCKRAKTGSVVLLKIIVLSMER